MGKAAPDSLGRRIFSSGLVKGFLLGHQELFSEAWPGESKRSRTFFTKYFLNSNDVPSTEHMVLSGVRVKCLEGEERQRAVTQDKVVGALQKRLLY